MGADVISVYVRTYMDVFNLGEHKHLNFGLFWDLKIYLSFKSNQVSMGWPSKENRQNAFFNATNAI